MTGPGLCGGGVIITDDTAKLWLKDKRGKLGASLVASEDGIAVLEFDDQDGKSRIHLGMMGEEASAAGLSIYRRTGGLLAALNATADDEAVMLMADAAGTIRLALGNLATISGNKMGIQVADSQGMFRSSLITNGDGTSGLFLKDNKDKLRGVLSVTDTGDASLIMKDNNDVLRLSVQRGLPALEPGLQKSC